MRNFSLFVLSVLSLALMTTDQRDGTTLVNRAYATTSPCDGVPGNAGPPVREPAPYISGAVVDASASTGISGVEVDLYRCNGSSSTYVTTDTTGSGGGFSFTSLSYPYWYYVEVDPSSGPGGLDPVAPTINPSALIEVGDGLSGLTLSFN